MPFASQDPLKSIRLKDQAFDHTNNNPAAGAYSLAVDATGHPDTPLILVKSDGTELPVGAHTPGPGTALVVQTDAITISDHTNGEITAADVGTDLIPANSIVPGWSAHIRIGGTFNSAFTPGNMTLSVVLGSASIVSQAIPGGGFFPNNRSDNPQWYVDMTIVCIDVTAGTATFYVIGFMAFLGSFYAISNNNQTVDITIDHTHPEVHWSFTDSASGNQLISKTSIIEIALPG